MTPESIAQMGGKQMQNEPVHVFCVISIFTDVTEKKLAGNKSLSGGFTELWLW